MKKLTKKINVLIFPAGSEIGMEIFNSLKYNLHVELFGASGKPDHAEYLYDNKHYAEGNYYIDEPSFLKRFNSLLTRFHIDVVFPTHDSIALFLAKNRRLIKAKILTSPYRSALVAREKKRTYALFRDCSFCPKEYTFPYLHAPLPLFTKPNTGQGGKGAFVVEKKADLPTSPVSDLVVTEYLPGEELSVDCFTNKRGELLFVGPRTRERVTFGISFRSTSIPLTSDISRIAREINRRVKIRGAWFFQVKRDSAGQYKLMEFAVRQASTMGVYRQQGVNFALLTIFDALGVDVHILRNTYSVELDRCLQNQYKLNLTYQRVYIDFDDTIIVNGRVNDLAIRFLYQCRNNMVNICLLTKHTAVIEKTLQTYRLSKALFDEIIVMDADDEKVNYINPRKAIFIDNYFYDREKVSKKLGIPVFDVDAIESLIQ